MTAVGRSAMYMCPQYRRRVLCGPTQAWTPNMALYLRDQPFGSSQLPIVVLGSAHVLGPPMILASWDPCPLDVRATIHTTPQCEFICSAAMPSI